MKRFIATMLVTAVCAGISLAWGQAMGAARRRRLRAMRPRSAQADRKRLGGRGEEQERGQTG